MTPYVHTKLDVRIFVCTLATSGRQNLLLISAVVSDLEWPLKVILAIGSLLMVNILVILHILSI